jgi:transposase-like protein
LADGAGAISAAVRDVFPSARRLMCWAHVFRNVQTRLNSFQKEIRQNILEDLGNLQMATNESEFDMAVQFLQQQWPESFYRYFSDTYLTSELKYFFEGASCHISTNNGLESQNKQIKRVHMLYKRAPLSKFLEKALDIVNHWSMTVEV